MPDIKLLCRRDGQMIAGPVRRAREPVPLVWWRPMPSVSLFSRRIGGAGPVLCCCPVLR